MHKTITNSVVERSSCLGLKKILLGAISTIERTDDYDGKIEVAALSLQASAFFRAATIYIQMPNETAKSSQCYPGQSDCISNRAVRETISRHDSTARRIRH